MTNSLRIATWNINSVRARIDQLKQFLSEFQPDVAASRKSNAKQSSFRTRR